MQFGDISQPVWERLVLTDDDEEPAWLYFLFIHCGGGDTISHKLYGYSFDVFIFIYLLFYGNLFVVSLFCFVFHFLCVIVIIVAGASERACVCVWLRNLVVSVGYLCDFFFSADRSLFSCFLWFSFLVFFLFGFNLIFSLLHFVLCCCCYY